MTPYEQARRIYELEDTFRTFDDDEQLHKDHGGYVINQPHLYVMARPVCLLPDEPLDEQRDFMTDPIWSFHEDSWNCWHVHIYAGKLDMLFTLLPFRLRYGSFQKRDRLRFYELKQLQERFDYGKGTREAKRSTTTSTTSARR